ncbi:hypothetical protein NERG_01283 [Nematocida ausubeli]|uniref:Clathrin/coatomer adaptor adaptin-like N-terminal domain-containing protein n=2 Tax=Nematocida ausubeli (strain ATCC PRA-371 / ERTm2) TaxID=1913371 RepID=H8ZC40_NEMA1|nr:hypothetical protein NERG_01283 [Nematocida ausubeli]
MRQQQTNKKTYIWREINKGMYTMKSALVANSTARLKSVFEQVKELLASEEKSKLQEAFHLISMKGLSHKEKAHVFPQILSMIGHSAIEIKCLAYSFILRSVRSDSSLLILAVNSLMQEMNSGHEGTGPSPALRAALAIDFISKIADAEFLNHFTHEIEKRYSSESDIVKKSALLAAPTLVRVFGETKLERIKQCLQEKSPVVLSAAISAIVAIEEAKPYTFSSEDVSACFRTLCAHRQSIEEAAGNFALLFSQLCRLLRIHPSSDAVEVAAQVLEFLPLCALRELAIINKGALSLAMVEKIANSLISYIGTRHKTDALESILLLLQKHTIKLETDPFIITHEDTQREKIQKLYILSLIGSPEGCEEISACIRDRECVHHAITLLLDLDILTPNHIKLGFQYSQSSTLRAIYSKHPLPEKYTEAIKGILGRMENVLEKEVYLFLAGYYLSSIPDEVNRIRRIRSSSSGVLYGKQEEREKPEEHLEEYMYFLLNMHTRGILSKEECIQQAQTAFSEEMFLFNKFMHLIDLPDRKHLLELIAYKRVLYKITGQHWI